MPSKSRPTQLKRQRERNLAEKRGQKAARRLQAKARRAAAPRQAGDEDPDLAGIRPGPQPRRDDEFPFDPSTGSESTSKDE
jgi:hypothetical protein